MQIHLQYSPESDCVIHHGDALDFMQKIPEDSIQLQVTSPPYNIGKEYERSTTLTVYREFLEAHIREMVRLCRREGSICWQSGNYVDRGWILPLDYMAYEIFTNYGMFLRNRIIWRFDHGLHASKRFSGRYETLLWFTKSDEYVFNLDQVRVPSKYPGKKHYKGPKKGELSGNPLGKNPGDFWSFGLGEEDNSVWDIPNVKCNHCEKTAHPCQFPVELVERCVLALTNLGDIVYDPFGGSGTTVIAALKNKCRGFMSESDPEYINIAIGRIKKFLEGELRIRALGTPVYEPEVRDESGDLDTSPEGFE